MKASKQNSERGIAGLYMGKTANGKQLSGGKRGGSGADESRGQPKGKG